MTTMYDVDANELIEKAGEELKKNQEIKPPAWAAFAKTGMHKERPPVDKDWWYIRAASVLRKIYRRGPIGVSKLRVQYGGKKNRGVKKEHFFEGSGNIVRKVLQQLEKAGYVKQVQKGAHKGRVITPQGRSFLDKIANQISGMNAKPKAEPVKTEPKKAEKAQDVKEKKEHKEQDK